METLTAILWNSSLNRNKLSKENASRLFLLMLPFMCLYRITNSNEIHLSGIVLDELDQPISEARVSLYKRDSLSTFTDRSGRFELTSETHISLPDKRIGNVPFITTDGTVLKFDLKTGHDAKVMIYNSEGRKVYSSSVVSGVNKGQKLRLPLASMPSGVYLAVVNYRENKTVIRYMVCSNGVFYGKPDFISGKDEISMKKSQAAEFRDILVFSAEGIQTLRMAITSAIQSDIKVKLMPAGTGYATPGIPVFSNNGGMGDVTTYGAVSDPEASQGGACNYGSTGIRYYAAINVHQFPGDLKGQWQGGQICGACAQVSVRTREGEIRSTIVRIMDKCPDDNCGIDLGGAPAGEIMGDQPGRYSGEWEWVNCDEAQGVSDGQPLLFVKAGSGKWWSLVQVRNGPGAVLEMRARKSNNGDWQSLHWATEAENFFSVPVEVLQDSDEWELEVLWRTGEKTSLRIPGEKLAIEEASCLLEY